MMEHIIYRDGSFDITGSGIKLKKCFPSVDGRRIAPVRVEVSGDEVRYDLADGSIRLHFHTEADGRAGITTEADGLPGLHDLLPVGESETAGIAKIYVQGFGMEGPSGFYRPDEAAPVSHGLTALCSDQAALTVYAEDHRRYSAAFQLIERRHPFGSILSFSGGFNLEGMSGDRVILPTLYFEEAADAAAGLSLSAKRIAAGMNARTHQPPAFYWSSWYYAYETMDQQTLEDTLAGIHETGTPFRYVELDAGYAPHCGDWLTPNHKWPGGLRLAAKTILDAGLQPGIWVAPFIVGDRSALYKEHPDWILRDLNGAPVVQLRSYTEPKIWGYPDCDYYVLDTSHPDALAYIGEVFRTLRSWGFSLFKTDFMLWSMHDSAAVRRHTPGLTSVEIMRQTLHVIRQSIGEESYLLGCIAPFMPFIGYADGMRLAGDCGAKWTGAYGPVNMLRELPCDNYFNHIFWQNDPDAVILRDFGTMFSDAETRSLALLQALSGGIVSTSDPVHLIRDDRKQLLRLITPDGPVTPAIPCLGEDRPEIVLTHRLPQGALLFVMNPTEEAVSFSCELSDLFGEDGWYQYLYDWDSDTMTEHRADRFSAALEPHGSALVFLAKAPIGKKPVNLWNW